MKYKGFEVDDNKIDEYCDKLDLSIIEACELILEESGKIEESAEVKAEIEKREKNAPKRYEKTHKERKPIERERKVDATKGAILAELKETLTTLGANVTEVKTETEVKFDFEGASYTLKLTKHRPPKGAK